MIKQDMTPFIQTKNQKIINKSGIGDIFESIHTTVMSNIQVFQGKVQAS